jgi:hypothetical protein
VCHRWVSSFKIEFEFKSSLSCQFGSSQVKSVFRVRLQVYFSSLSSSQVWVVIRSSQVKSLFQFLSTSRQFFQRLDMPLFRRASWMQFTPSDLMTTIAFWQKQCSSINRFSSFSTIVDLPAPWGAPINFKPPDHPSPRAQFFKVPIEGGNILILMNDAASVSTTQSQKCFTVSVMSPPTS